MGIIRKALTTAAVASALMAGARLPAPAIVGAPGRAGASSGPRREVAWTAWSTVRVSMPSHPASCLAPPVDTTCQSTLSGVTKYRR